MDTIFQNMADKWGAEVVARTQISQFTGGLISEKYIANLDSQNKGPAGRFRCGRKVAYPVNEFVKWLEARSAFIPERQQKSEAAQ